MRGWIILIASGVWGCGPGAAPPPTPSDAARLPDAGAQDGAMPRDASRRSDVPRLPPADLEFVLPYLGPEQEAVREVRAAPGRLDVHFSIDTTGSFGGEIDALQADLTTRIVPALEERVADLAVGVSRFEDFDLSPFGQPGDVPYELLSPITIDRSLTRAAVARLDNPFGSGGDGPESGYEALFQIATGFGYRTDGVTWIPAREGMGGGGVDFRPGSIRAVVHATDAPSHVPSEYAPALEGVRGFADVVEAMGLLDVFVLGIASNARARPQLESLALTTGAAVPAEGARCETGIGESHPPRSGMCPLVFDVSGDGTGLSDAIVDALVGLLDTVRFDEVFGRAVDDRLGFVQAIEAREAIVPDGVSEPRVSDRRPTDGIDDTFEEVGPGTELRFAVRLRNVHIPPADYDQVFRIAIEIVGGGLVLDEVTIRIVVPRGRLDGGPRDGGAAGGTDAGLDAGPDVDADASTDASPGDADAGPDTGPAA